MSSTKHPKILIIEDNSALLYGLEYQFKQKKFLVKTALDSKKVFEILDTWTPTVILLDILLPDKDGFQLLSEIKNNPKFSQIPIIVASNLDQPKDEIVATKLGASAFFIKNNISLDQLVKEVSKFVH